MPFPPFKTFSRSLFLSLTAIFAVGTALVVGILTYLLHTQSSDLVHRMTYQRAEDVTTLLARQATETIKFGDSRANSAIFEELMAESDGHLIAALAMDSSENVVGSAQSDGASIGKLRQLARRALETGKTQRGENGIMLAVPATFGNDGAVAGAVALHWTTDVAMAAMSNATSKEVTKTIAVFLVTVLLASLALRTLVSRPLRKATAALSELGAGNLQIDLPETKRNDEIGVIFRELATYREALNRSAAAQDESDYKSAAFEGSSAAMMITDSDLIVRYINPAMQQLLRKLADVIRQTVPGFDPEAVIGRNIDTFHSQPQPIRRMLSDQSRMPFTTVMALGETRLSLDCNSAIGSDGTSRGIVTEWKDITEEWLNNALLSAIDKDQVKAEFDPEGRLLDANEQFGSLAGKSVSSMIGQQINSLIEPVGASDTRIDAVLRAAIEKGTEFGKFRLLSARGDDATLNGGFSCVKDHKGKPIRLVLLSQDVTEAERSISAAQAERREMMQNQKRVVEELQIGLNSLSLGDLTARIDQPFASDYEQLRHDFNAAVTSLGQAMHEVVVNAESIRNEAADISTTADTLSRKTENTAATLEETAAALDRLTSSVKIAAEGATKADGIVSDAKVKAEHGGDVVSKTISAMDLIAESSDKITSIIKVIDDIAFQTNLLALNAGVEAARAGEAGRGFAVVASEVRDLAQRSSEAAREISGLIAASGTQVKTGVDLVDQTGSALKEIVQSVTDISNHVSDIAQSSMQQSTSLEEINNAVTDLDQSTQQNAARFEETTAASHALTGDATALAETVSRFTIERDARDSNVVHIEKTGAPEFTSARKTTTPRAAGSPGGRTATAAQTKQDDANDTWEDF
ncbi:MAG: methyl-accepting chemotaxis protein [Paracoccaceae bacterium]